MISQTLEPQPDTRRPLTRERLEAAYDRARSHLLSERDQAGFWVGELASSALSTAVAVCALALVDRQRFAPLITGGVRWLRDHQNSDGGWGDTVISFSNISTSALCHAALVAGGKAAEISSPEYIEASLHRAAPYLEGAAGGHGPQALARAIRARYGKDRTFSVPILSCCALSGVVPWDEVPELPFELACLTGSVYKWVNLPVVSYALPALIALGIVRYTLHSTRNPATRALRQKALPGALRKLESLQPANGGFLEATPLTSFVTMSLAGAGFADHPVVRKGVDFLVNSLRSDGSWPIDTNLSTWVTTLTINALCEASEGVSGTSSDGRSGTTDGLRHWLIDQQYRSVHPFTLAAPGGWGWTPLAGAVPDADDTAGALLALRNLGVTEDSRRAAAAGLTWLLELQNRDGGWPTFCRGWGYLPFDRSSTDITAHALRALHAWGTDPALSHFSGRLRRAIHNGFRFLERHQRPDGSWLPLWFGNQHAPDDVNPTYGTARVLAAYRDLNMHDTAPACRGWQWLIASRNSDGGWGGTPGTPSSVEETALATEALLDCRSVIGSAEAASRGLRWLIGRVEDDSFRRPSPIGFYFARLWYFEKLYPVIFTVGALGRALRLMKGGPAGSHPD